VTKATGAKVLRASGFALIATSAPGVADPLDPMLDAVTLTQVATHSGAVSDHYDVAGTADGSVVSASGPILAANDRVAYWPSTQAATADEAACASWSSQTPAQATGVGVQQGLVLRASTVDGVTRAITITKNIWGGAFDVLNVHLWNTSLATPYAFFGRLDLEPFFTASDETALPYDVCAEVVGDELDVAFWFSNQTPPVWGATGQTASFTLPADWDYAGEAGFYVGHLPTGGATTYENEYSGPPLAEPSA
jgi:hypothetical protein